MWNDIKAEYLLNDWVKFGSDCQQNVYSYVVKMDIIDIHLIMKVYLMILSVFCFAIW